MKTTKNTTNTATNFVHNAANTYDDMIQAVDTIARMATAGTLKRIYTSSADKKVHQFIYQLQGDFATLDNNNDTNAQHTISDAYDIYLTAYDFLYNKIMVLMLNPQDTITVKQKNGKDKTRTVYQWACIKVRQYLYSNKGIEDNGKKPIFIDDLKRNPEESDENALDREYIKVGKYQDIQNYHDYTTIDEMRLKLKFTDRQDDILTLRLRGMSVTDIAEKFGVSQPAISKHLMQMREKIIKEFPDLTRGFDLDHI